MLVGGHRVAGGSFRRITLPIALPQNCYQSCADVPEADPPRLHFPRKIRFENKADPAEKGRLYMAAESGDEMQATGRWQGEERRKNGQECYVLRAEPKSVRLHLRVLEPSGHAEMVRSAER